MRHNHPVAFHPVPHIARCGCRKQARPGTDGVHRFERPACDGGHHRIHIMAAVHTSHIVARVLVVHLRHIMGWHIVLHLARLLGRGLHILMVFLRLWRCLGGLLRRLFAMLVHMLRLRWLCLLLRLRHLVLMLMLSSGLLLRCRWFGWRGWMLMLVFFTSAVLVVSVLMP